MPYAWWAFPLCTSGICVPEAFSSIAFSHVIYLCRNVAPVLLWHLHKNEWPENNHVTKLAAAAAAGGEDAASRVGGKAWQQRFFYRRLYFQDRWTSR